MKQNNEKESLINPNIKLNELYKYAKGENSRILSYHNSNQKKANIINLYNKHINNKNEETRYRYNNSLDKKIVYINNNNVDSDSEISDINENNQIFTTIKTILNKDYEYMNNRYNTKDIEYDAITDYKNRRSPKYYNAMYKKSRTPDRNYIYYKKIKKRDSTNNTYSISYCTESNNQNNKSNIYDSLEEPYKKKKQEYYRKIVKKMKNDLKINSNNENNNYIDLFTIDDVITLQNKINLEKLSKARIPLQNKLYNTNIYKKKNSINSTNRVVKPIKSINKPLNNITKSRNLLSKVYYEDINSKSYDCITFKTKIGMYKSRKKKQKKLSKSFDNYSDKGRRNSSKGTPIKKENDKGGKVDFLGNIQDMKNKKHKAAIIIQNWWRKYNLIFINKILLIQKIFRNYINRKEGIKILYKKTTLKTLHKSNNKIENNNIINDTNNYMQNNNNNLNNDNKDVKNDNNEENKTIKEEDIILIQRIFRQFLINKMNEKNIFKDIINYIPKEICEMTKTRMRIIKPNKNMINKKKLEKNNKIKPKIYIKNNNINNLKAFRNENNNNNNNKINNNNNKNPNNTHNNLYNNNNNNNINNKVDKGKKDDNEKSKNNEVEFVKKHHYTKSKLSRSPLNKILISKNLVRYDTDRYTFLKKCDFRNREEDRERNELYRAATTEYMRKINLKIKGRYLTPDKNQNRRVNPLLKIDNLGEEANIELLSKSPDKNNQNEKNKGINKNNLEYSSNHQRNSDKNEQKSIKDGNCMNTNNQINSFKNNKYDNEEKKEDLKETKDDNNASNKKDIDNKSNNEKDNINLDNLTKMVSIPYQYLERCKMGEIIINKNKEEKELQTEEEKEKIKIKKIILIQRNIKIFLERIKPKITKIKKTFLIKDEEEKINVFNDVYKNIINERIIYDKINEKINNLENIDNISEEDNQNDNLRNGELEEISNSNGEDNNNNKNNKKEEFIEENIDSDNDKIEKPKQNEAKNLIEVNINNEKFINTNKDNEMKFINKISNKASNIINNTNINLNNNEEVHYVNKIHGKAKNINKNIKNNEETDYLNKIPNKANNLINSNINIKNSEEMIYISKIPNKANNITKNINNKEPQYFNKIPGKVVNITNYSNNKINNEEMFYINKVPIKAKNLIKNKNLKEETIKDKNEDSNSSINIDNMRNSCPAKELNKLTYKKYKKDYLENILKDNIVKFAINQLKEIGIHYKYFRFDYIVKMFVQKIQKINKQFVFLKLKGEGFIKHENVYFEVIKTYLNNPDLYIKDNNDVSNLLNNVLPFYSNMYKKYKFIPYIKEDDEDKLINTELFRRDENGDNLISFICKYLKLSKNITNFSEDLIRYHLNKKRLLNFNIFGLTRYINLMGRVLHYSKVDPKELQKKDNLSLAYININNEIKEDVDNINIELKKLDRNKKYTRRTINYNKTNKISLKRHVTNLSSCDINNNSFENIPNANDSLIKKNIDK